MQKSTQQPDPLPEKQPGQQLVAGQWYQTGDGRFVKILFEDLNLGKLVGQLDARELLYDRAGKAYYLTLTDVQEAPAIYHVRNMKPVPEPPVREYMMHINIDATVLMRGRSVQEVMALIPDLIDLEPLDNDVQVRNFTIKVSSSHVIQPEK